MNWMEQLQQRIRDKAATSNEQLLKDAAGQAGGFANQGQANYGNMTNALAGDRAYLEGLRSGQNSLSAEQLRQGLQSQYAQQQSMAAGASPANAPMAARTAMMNANRAATGMAGNAAMAGIAERNAAAQALNDLNLGQRAQDVNVALGSRGNQMTGLGANKPDQPKGPSWGDRLMQGAGLGLSLFSDERLKTNVKDGAKHGRAMLAALKPHTYDYKDPKHGAGKQLGVMAQDLERAGLKQAVIDTPEGKMVDHAKLTGANTAWLADLGQRVKKLEKGR